MAAETQYIANTGIVTISTGNTAIDGSGAVGTVFTANASYKGALIKTVTIKATTDTAQGMVRLFIYDGSVTKLIKEVEVPAVIKSATSPSYGITFPLNIILKAGWSLKASTEVSNSFNVIAEAQDWAYNVDFVLSDTTKYTANNGAVSISTANSALDGSGTLGTVMTSSGCNLVSVTIKATVNTTAGMIRLFLYNGTSSFLFMEIPVIATIKSAISPSFYHKIVFENFYALKSSWQLRASTQVGGENFNIISEFLDLSYPTWG
ncbi:MAG: hypothetical protein HY951_14425 [Bacteroidia bacterium]|nr:hypothetical protein [Bacteroidia bacterium]